MDLLTLQMTIKNPGDDCELHVIIMLMVYVLPYPFHGGLAQVAEEGHTSPDKEDTRGLQGG